MRVETRKLFGKILDWAVAKCEGHEVMLFDDLWRSNALGKGYPAAEVEQHLQWQHQRGQYVIVELRHLQLDQTNPEITTPTRCARDIPPYSTDWAQGGPIIERVGIDLRQIKSRPFSLYEYRHIDRHPDAEVVAANYAFGPGRMIKVRNTPAKNEGRGLARMSVNHSPFGWSEKDFISDTVLAAAMRCYVASRMGDEIDVPDDLMLGVDADVEEQEESDAPHA